MSVIIKSMMKRIGIEWIRYIQFFRKQPDAFVVLDLPEIKTSAYIAKDLYSYYWFAENIQYFPFPLKQVDGWFSRTKKKALQGSSFGIIPLIYDMDAYFAQVIKSSERALIRKAIKNNYTCRAIKYDDYLQDILDINTSKGERQGSSMSDDYIHLVKRDSIVAAYNPDIYSFGCFDATGKLVAYYMFEKFTNFIHVNKGIGHLAHLNMGVMNYLFAYSLCELSNMHRGLSLVYGGFIPNSDNGLNRFKKHVGCQSKTVVYQGSTEQFRALSFFLNHYSLHGDSGLNFVIDYIENQKKADLQ